MQPTFLSIGRVDLPTRQRWRAAGLTVIEGFGGQISGWSLTSYVCVGHIGDPVALADAIEAASRGASLAVTVTDAFADALADDARRLGLRPGADSGVPSAPDRRPAGAAGSTTPEWAVLLELLAEGLSVAEAARSCHISLRSAYRRLDTARKELAVTSTTAAVVAWKSQRG